MKTVRLLYLLVLALTFGACYEEDPGPKQTDSRTYAMVDFDRLEISDGLIANIKQGAEYNVFAEGDRRNLDDLEVFKSGNTLIIRYSNYYRRQYDTRITITLPYLSGAAFSGGMNVRMDGFANAGTMDLAISGASIVQSTMDATELLLTLSGASQVLLTGNGNKIQGTVSGASLLSAFDYPINEANLVVSGASNVKISPSQLLKVNASGASIVVYKGSPQLAIESSGSSTVRAY